MADSFSQNASIPVTLCPMIRVWMSWGCLRRFLLTPGCHVAEDGVLVGYAVGGCGVGSRIQKQLQATGSGSVEEVLLHLLETQEEQDRWLAENREMINVKIRRGIEQLDRGQGIPEDQLDAYLARLKAKPE